MGLLPTLTVTDPANASILFDLVNHALTTSPSNDVDTRARLVDMLIALHTEMNRTDNLGEQS